MLLLCLRLISRSALLLLFGAVMGGVIAEKCPIKVESYLYLCYFSFSLCIVGCSVRLVFQTVGLYHRRYKEELYLAISTREEEGEEAPGVSLVSLVLFLVLKSISLLQSLLSRLLL